VSIRRLISKADRLRVKLERVNERLVKLATGTDMESVVVSGIRGYAPEDHNFVKFLIDSQRLIGEEYAEMCKIAEEQARELELYRAGAPKQSITGIVQASMEVDSLGFKARHLYGPIITPPSPLSFPENGGPSHE